MELIAYDYPLKQPIEEQKKKSLHAFVLSLWNPSLARNSDGFCGNQLLPSFFTTEVDGYNCLHYMQYCTI